MRKKLQTLIIDGKEEITSSDRILTNEIKKSGKPYILIINKIDVKKNEKNSYEYYELGLGDPIFISAQEGRQVGNILDRINQILPPNVILDNESNKFYS